jgi:hypothetical protein
MHFYCETEKGIEPRHFVPMKTKPELTRPSRMSDAKAAAKKGELWHPSVTTILGVLDKPALVSWKVEQHLETAFEMMTNGIVANYLDGFIRDVKLETELRLDAAPKAGTDCHKMLEEFFKDGIVPSDDIGKRICDNVARVLADNCGSQQWEYEKYLVNKAHGFAGCTDLSSADWVVDYKTKREASKFKVGKMAYPEHSRQLAAYGQTLNAYKAANIFICLENGEVDFHEHSRESLDDGWLDFIACLGIFNRSKN